jgi:hypothetical protein
MDCDAVSTPGAGVGRQYARVAEARKLALDNPPMLLKYQHG